MNNLKITLPHDPELELTVMRMAYQHQEKLFNRIQEQVKASNFYDQEYQKIFAAMVELQKSELPFRPHLVTSQNGLDRTKIATLVSEPLPFHDPQPLCARLVQLHLKRYLIRQGFRWIEELQKPGKDPTELWASLQSGIGEMMSDQIKTENLQGAMEVAVDLQTHLEEQYAGTNQLSGIKTQLYELNLAIGGFLPSKIVILGARPGVGKTAIAGNWALFMADRGHKVLMISVEMSSQEILARLLARKAQVSGFKLSTRPRFLTSEERQRTIDSISEVAWPNLYFYDSPSVTSEDAFWVCDVAKRKMGGLDCVIVDYLQLMTTTKATSRTSRNEYIGSIARDLREIARRFKVPVIVLSQLSRECKEGQEPQLSHLRDSGEIEQTADVVLFMWREKRKGSEEFDISIKVAKQRNGPLETIPMLFDKETLWFSDVPREGGYEIDP